MLVTAPVGAGHVEQLERAQPAGAVEVAAAAQVLERAVAVEGDDVTFRWRQVADDLDLIRLVAGLEFLDRLGAGRLGALEAQVGGLLVAHPPLDLLEVGRGQRARQVEVVVEAVLDRRADSQLGVGEHLHHRRGEHVRRAVPHCSQRILRRAGVQQVGGSGSDLVGIDGHWTAKRTASRSAAGEPVTPRPSDVRPS